MKLWQGFLGASLLFLLTACPQTPAPPPDFTISLNPTSLSIQQGGSSTTTLTITPQSGFTGTVNLSLVGAPSGVTLSPTSVTVSGSSPVNQTLTVSVAGNVAPGTYNLQVRATSGSLTKTANLTLTVTADELITALQGVSQDIQGTLSQLNQELQELLQELQELLQLLRGNGQSTPLSQGLQTLEQRLDPLAYLKQPLPRPQELLGGILPQGVQTPLPRGKFACPYNSGCQVGTSDDLEMRFQKPDGTWNKLFADWDYSSKGASSPTVYVHDRSDTQGQYLQEMPTKAFGSLDLKEDGTNEGEATFQATWRPSTCVSGKYLTEPGNLSLTGFLQRPAGTGRLVDLPSLSLTTSASQLKLVWNLSLLTQGNDADLHTEGFIQINGSSTPGTCGSLLEKFNASSGEVDVKLDTRNHAARLYFKITDWNENTGAITIQNGYLTVDGKTVTFAGVLDDANGNCVPGENLTLTFASGQTMSLETYLIQKLGASPCR
jgi:hypothetical protein